MKIVVVITLLILSSCGVQGDLYLPDNSAKKDQPKDQQQDQQQDQ
jgi:predicted small lipoprotein YifL